MYQRKGKSSHGNAFSYDCYPLKLLSPLISGIFEEEITDGRTRNSRI